MERLIQGIRTFFRPKHQAAHLDKGASGERAAEQLLRRRGLKLLARNFATRQGEIDLIFREDTCMVFVEVKTRSDESWSRPAAAVDASKKARICKTALEYLRQLHHPECSLRFDIVEVLLDEGSRVREIRHLPDAFSMKEPMRYQR